MLPQWANMLSWWQWAILAAVPPAIVALYFLKLKRRPVQVPSTYLWHKTVEDLHVNSIWQRLRRNLLLWLQLLVVALAILALLRPGWRGMQLAGNRFIFLIDNSASMQATDVTPSRLEEAKRRVGELVDQMGDDAAMIVSFSDTARVEQTFTRDRAALRRSLAAIRPTQRRTSLAEALKVAAGLANPGQSADNTNIRDFRVAEARPAKLLIFSDGKFDDVAGFALGNLDPVYVPIASPQAANVGIVAFSVRRNEARPDRLQAFAELENFGPQDVTVDVELFRDDQPAGGQPPAAGERPAAIAADRLAILAGKGRGVSFDLGNLISGTLRLKANTGDHLALDDQAWVVINPPQRANVLLVTPGNKPLQLAFSTELASQWAAVRTEPPAFLDKKEYRDQIAAGGYDLVIYDRCRPAVMPPANTLFIASLPSEGGWTAKPKVSLPQIYDTDSAHPLLQGIDLGGVLVAEAAPLVIPAGGRVLIDADVGPLLAIAPREGWEDAVLAFPLVQQPAAGEKDSAVYYGSNWHTRPSFPLFTFNLLHYLGAKHDVLAGETVRPGQAVTIHAGRAQRRIRVQTPSGGMLDLSPARPGEFTFNGTDQTGVYTIELGSENPQRFAVNLFDRAESDIRAKPGQAIKIGYVDVAAKAGWEASRREIWRFLLVAGLFVLLTEWYIYGLRISR
jgi:hypothetical protein